MNLFSIDIGEIGEMASQVGITGAIQVSGAGDDVFEFIVAVAILIYELSPG